MKNEISGPTFAIFLLLIFSVSVLSMAFFGGSRIGLKEEHELRAANNRLMIFKAMGNRGYFKKGGNEWTFQKSHSKQQKMDPTSELKSYRPTSEPGPSLQSSTTS